MGPTSFVLSITLFAGFLGIFVPEYGYAQQNSQYEQQYQQQYPQKQTQSQPKLKTQNQRQSTPKQSNQQQNIPQPQQAVQPQQAAQPQPLARKPAPVKQKHETPQGPVMSLALTHLLPSAYVIPANTFIFGTTAGYGVGNMFDVTTNLFQDLEQNYNINLKLKLYKGKNFAVAPWVSYYNTQDNIIGTDVNGNPQVVTVTTSAVSPGLTFSYRIARRVTGHLGGDMVFRTPAIPKNSLSQRTSYIQGNQVFKEFTFGIGEFVALAVGGSYDLTYDVWGAGLTFHLSGIVVGAHYYLNVSQGSILPIIGGGYAINF